MPLIPFDRSRLVGPAPRAFEVVAGAAIGGVGLMMLIIEVHWMIMRSSLLSVPFVTPLWKVALDLVPGVHARIRFTRICP